MPDRKHKVRGDDPRFSQPAPRNDCRQLQLDDGTWQWKTGKRYETVIYHPNGDRRVVTLGDMLGIPGNRMAGIWSSIERGKYTPEITPGKVREYIEANLAC